MTPDQYKRRPEESKVSESKTPYTPINIQKIKGDGAFPCPGCGVTISPDDETEKVYTVTGTEFKGDSLVYLKIRCKCGKKIKLNGFLPESDK